MSDSNNLNTEQEIQELEKELLNVPEDINEEESILRDKELHTKLGNKYEEIDAYDEAISHYEKVISILLEAQAPASEKADMYYRLAQIYNRTDQPELALNTYHQALEAIHGQQDKLSGDIYHELGNLYFLQAEWDKALEYYHQSLDHHQLNQQLFEIGRNYNMIGALYANQEKNKEALINLEKAIEWNQRTENYKSLAQTFSYLRLFLDNAMSIKNKFTYYRNWLNRAEEEQQTGLLAFLNYNLGHWYHEEDKKEKALESFEKALQLKQEINITTNQGNIHYYIGSIQEAKENHQLAIQYHIKALDLMLEHKHYDNAGMVMYFLETSLDSIQDETQKAKINELIDKATELGFGFEEEIEMEDDPLGVFEDELVTNESLAQNASQVLEQEQNIDTPIEQLEEDYDSFKTQLPEKLEDFTRISWLLLVKLHQNYKDSWFAKKKKRKIFDDKKLEVNTIYQELLSSPSLEADLKEDLEERLSEIEKLA